MDAPVGIFDSGVGGLTVWSEIVKLLPNESIVYFADSINCPYGHKALNDIIDLSIKNVEFLLQKNCKIIVVACNTATGAAITELRKKYDVLFVGMEPAVKPAAIKSKTKNIGILATEGTFNGNHYQNTSSKFTDNVNIHTQIGIDLVDHVEKGDFTSNELRNKLNLYLKPMIEKNIDNIVLGCTHYPFLIELIEQITANKINIINPAPAVAKRLKFLLDKNNLNNTRNLNPNHKFYTNGEKEIIMKLLEQLQIKNASIQFPDII